MNTERELLDRMAKSLRRATRENDINEYTHADLAEARTVLAQYDALPPATADAPAKEHHIAFLESMSDDDWEYLFLTRPDLKARLKTQFDAYATRLAHPQTQPSAATAVNTAGACSICGSTDDVPHKHPAGDPRKPCGHLDHWACSSPPASASMSAEVTDAMVEAAGLAIFGTQHGGLQNQRIREGLEAAERARANTRAGVDIQSVIDLAKSLEDDLYERHDYANSDRAGVIVSRLTAGDAKGAG